MTTSVRTSQEEGISNLFQRYIEARDRKIRDKLVLMHQNLVRYLAGKFANRGVELEDLVQVGMIGLINAIDRFDPERGTKFSTYATPTITGEIRRHFRDKGWSLKVPRRLQELNLAATKATDELIQRLERQPTILEIADEIGADETETLKAIGLGQYYDTVSLDAKIGPSKRGDDSLTLSEFVGVPQIELEDISEYGELRKAVELLDRRDRAIIHYRFFENETQTLVASRVKVSQMQVSRLQTRAMKALKNIIVSMDGRTSFVAIGVSEARVVFSLWPYLSYTWGRNIDRKKIAINSGLVQGYLSQVISRLVELGILIRTTDGKYKRGIATVFFNGRRVPRASNGLKIVKYQFYNLDKVATGLISFKPKKKKQVVITPQVCHLKLRDFLATCVIWPSLKETEPRPIDYTRLQRVLQRMTRTSAIAMVSKLKKIGVVENNSHGQWVRGCKNVKVGLYGLGCSVLSFSADVLIKEGEVYDLNVLSLQLAELMSKDPQLIQRVLRISRKTLTLSKQQAIVAMFLWPMLSEENERSLDFGKLAEEIGLNPVELTDLVCQLEHKGILVSHTVGLYDRGKSAFWTHFDKNDQGDSKMLFNIKLKNGVRCDLNKKVKKPSQRLRKVGGITGVELPQLTTSELDACLIIWPQLADGGWAIPDYNKISRRIDVTYIQSYCFIRKVIGKGILAKEGNHVRKVKADFIYWKGKGGKESQVCSIKLVEYHQAYDLNELSKSVKLTT